MGVRRLLDDCCGAAKRLMPLDEALAVIDRDLVAVTDVEAAPLWAALGRVLARDVVSAVDLPPATNSAMDGYALAAADVAGPDGGETVLPVTGRQAAGRPLEGEARPGAAVRIFTGAPMPAGCDAVVMQEEVTLQADGRVVIPPGVKPGRNVRRAGEDVAAGAVVLRAGTRLRPQDIAMAAAAGCAGRPVSRPLRVALFSTGDELHEPGTPLPAGGIYDSNRHALRAMLAGLPVTVTDLGRLMDDPAAVRRALEAAALDHDVVMTTGGVSVGEEDHVRQAVEAQGAITFWRLNIKPGKPVALGRVGETVFLGLPGNPVATAVTFLLVARPILLRLAGAADIRLRRFQVPAGFSYVKKEGRREFIRVRLETRPDGSTLARLDRGQGSHMISSLVDSHALAELAEDSPGVTEGESLTIIPFPDTMAG
ncbi:molybdopterin molybdotransferase MoeA [Caenispirillum bisanense]|uniref:molybdopterin molybdotransferase MoeA n=1 Tax=Caenispirillum bisanense TaxID=414052 RepID=UPI0031D54D55